MDIKVIDVGVFVALQAEENTSGRFFFLGLVIASVGRGGLDK